MKDVKLNNCTGWWHTQAEKNISSCFFFASLSPLNFFFSSLCSSPFLHFLFLAPMISSFSFLFPLLFPSLFLIYFAFIVFVFLPSPTLSLFPLLQLHGFSFSPSFCISSIFVPTVHSLIFYLSSPFPLLSLFFLLLCSVFCASNFLVPFIFVFIPLRMFVSPRCSLTLLARFSFSEK